MADAGDIPTANGAILAAAKQCVAVRRECERVNRTLMAFKIAHQGSRQRQIVELKLDYFGGIINHEGLDYEAVRALFLNKKGNKLDAPNMIPFEDLKNQIWDVKADIFIPGAASKIITREQVDSLIANGVQVISCGANVPFIDDQVFFGATAHYADAAISVIPDFVANCGMARVFAYLMQHEVEVTDEAIFNDVSATIRQALVNIRAENDATTNISTTALGLALKKLV